MHSKGQQSFPFDDDGDVLRSLQSKGVDLGQARDIDFYCFAKDRRTANRIMKMLNNIGLKSEVFQSAESKKLGENPSVYATKRMVPDYDDLINMQARLNELLAPFDTHCDGWGTLVDPAQPSSLHVLKEESSDHTLQ